MGDEKDRLGDKLHQAEMGRENEWARQRDTEILERLRRRNLRGSFCPQCRDRLEAPAATIGVSAMACPSNHGVWANGEALAQLRARLENAADIHHESLGEKVSAGLAGIVEGLRRTHVKELDCPDCGVGLSVRVAIAPGKEGLAAMGCPNRHGAWIDHDLHLTVRDRLCAAAGGHSSR